MTASLALLSCLLAGMSLASPDEVASMLDQLGGADLVLVNDPAGARPYRVLLATHVAAPVDKLQSILANPAAYRQAMPAFQRTDVVASKARKGDVTDKQIAWELEVPLWNLSGKLWLFPRADGVDLELSEGDFAPGVFHLAARRPRATKSNQSILVVEGFANIRDANVATRELTQRSPLAEPAMTVAAAYVMLKAMAIFAERGMAARSGSPMAAPEPGALQGARLGKLLSTMPTTRKIVAAVRNRGDGRLEAVELGIQVGATANGLVARSLDPQTYRGLPGWKKFGPVVSDNRACIDKTATCWRLESNLPLFSLDGTYRISPHPWRARMVDGDCTGAVLGLDVVQARGAGRSILVLSRHPRLDRAGYVPRKLIAAEPLLEQGLALALTLVEAVALAPALAR